MKFLFKNYLMGLIGIEWSRAVGLFFRGFLISAVFVCLFSAQAAYAANDLPVNDLLASQLSNRANLSSHFSAQTSHQQASSEPASINKWKAVIALNPTSDIAWNNLGQKLFVAQQYAGALRAYDHALVISPDYSLALANRCGVLSQLENYDQALVSCDMALKGDGRWGAQGSALAWNNRGDALFNLKKYKASLRAFEKAILIDPDLKGAWYNRALALSQIQQQ